MALPVNIEHLLSKRKIESERIEFKKGWNPLKTMHTICAFANDFHNLGGGYIVVGATEKNGVLQRPVTGIPEDQLDQIQKEIVEIGHKIVPFYHPIIEPYKIDEKWILILWVPGGQSRPYKALTSFDKSTKEYAYFIKKGSLTVKAKDHDESELISLAAKIPFDDRINQQATLDDLDLGLIIDFLKKIKSDLFKEVQTLPFEELCRKMNIAEGPEEHLFPKNVSLLFFNENPDKFFPQTQIDIVHFPEGSGANVFKEKIIKGPIHKTLSEALSYLKNQIIIEKVKKIEGQAEAERYFNYPFEALEEIITNAVYHRSYEIREPIEIRIFPENIQISSFPGPDRSILKSDIKKFKFISRRYRNRRIGEFLKELEMTEGRGTGIPKIMREIKKNNSPDPIFHTDEDRSYLVVEIQIHPEFIEENKATAEVTAQVTAEVTAEVKKLVEAIEGEMTRRELQNSLRLKNDSHFRKSYIVPAIEKEVIEMTIPDNPNSRLQKYRLTEKGKRLKTKFQ